MPRDIYNLDMWFTTELGESLLAWVNNPPNSYPPDRTYDEWVAQLRAAGESLVEYKGRWDESNNEEHTLENAKSALHWVADHLENLWD